MLKRLLDIFLSVLGLILTAPVIAIASLAILFTMGVPILFAQERVGRLDRVFTIYKLRTMSNAVMRDGAPLSDGIRLTWLGKLLRKMSIDEIPQLVNVLRGEMSLVGPRPLPVVYLSYYTPRERIRHLVRPGLTGLAQIHGRNTQCWDDRLELDVKYVESMCLALDLRIMIYTVATVLFGKGLVVDPSASLTTLVEHRAHNNGY